jgi:hypothetical protein
MEITSTLSKPDRYQGRPPVADRARERGDHATARIWYAEAAVLGDEYSQQQIPDWTEQCLTERGPRHDPVTRLP